MEINSPLAPKPFRPPVWLRPAMVQTIMAGQKFRKRGNSAMEQVAISKIFTSRDNVKLKGSLSHNPESRGLVIFLSGWEGSENSTYIVACARRLYDLGYSVFRLNFRDHGDTHHLNEDMFHAVRLVEVYDAVSQAAALVQGQKFIVGFSLGGNFALRLARQFGEFPIPDIEHIFAISPVIDPWHASPMIDQNPVIKRYFYKKWMTNLAKKQAAFPDRYDFSFLKR